MIQIIWKVFHLPVWINYRLHYYLVQPIVFLHLWDSLPLHKSLLILWARLSPLMRDFQEIWLSWVSTFKGNNLLTMSSTSGTVRLLLTQSSRWSEPPAHALTIDPSLGREDIAFMRSDGWSWFSMHRVRPFRRIQRLRIFPPSALSKRSISVSEDLLNAGRASESPRNRNKTASHFMTDLDKLSCEITTTSLAHMTLDTLTRDHGINIILTIVWFKTTSEWIYTKPLCPVNTSPYDTNITPIELKIHRPSAQSNQPYLPRCMHTSGKNQEHKGAQELLTHPRTLSPWPPRSKYVLSNASLNSSDIGSSWVKANMCST